MFADTSGCRFYILQSSRPVCFRRSADCNESDIGVKVLMDNKTLQDRLSKNGRDFGVAQWPVEKMITRLFHIYEKNLHTNKGTLKNLPKGRKPIPR